MKKLSLLSIFIILTACGGGGGGDGGSYTPTPTPTPTQTSISFNADTIINGDTEYFGIVMKKWTGRDDDQNYICVTSFFTTLSKYDDETLYFKDFRTLEYGRVWAVSAEPPEIGVSVFTWGNEETGTTSGETSSFAIPLDNMQSVNNQISIYTKTITDTNPSLDDMEPKDQSGNINLKLVLSDDSSSAQDTYPCVPDLRLSVLFLGVSSASTSKSRIFGSDGDDTFLFMYTKDVYDQTSDDLVSRGDIISELMAGIKIFNSYGSRPTINFDADSDNPEDNFDEAYEVKNTLNPNYGWSSGDIWLNYPDALDVDKLDINNNGEVYEYEPYFIRKMKVVSYKDPEWMSRIDLFMLGVEEDSTYYNSYCRGRQTGTCIPSLNKWLFMHPEKEIIVGFSEEEGTSWLFAQLEDTEEGEKVPSGEEIIPNNVVVDYEPFYESLSKRTKRSISK
jgi:hypothetical protein